MGLAWGQKRLLTSSHMNSSVQNLDFELGADPAGSEHTRLPLTTLGADPTMSTQRLPQEHVHVGVEQSLL